MRIIGLLNKKKPNLWIVFACIVFNLWLGKLSFAEAAMEQRVANFYEIYRVKTITNTSILPDTFPIPGYKSSQCCPVN